MKKSKPASKTHYLEVPSASPKTKMSPKPSRKHVSQPEVRIHLDQSETPSTSPKLRPRTNSCVASPRKLSVPTYEQRERSASFGNTGRKPLLNNLRSKSPARSNSNMSLQSNQSSSESIASSHHNTSTGNSRHDVSSEQPANDLIFDYIHGEIKHRPKTAFGSIVHQSANTKTSPKPPKKEMKHDDSGSSNSEDESVVATANDFLNQCIINSEQTWIKPPEKPQSSSAFDKILKEFMPEDDIDFDEEPQKTFRERTHSMPASVMAKNGSNLVPCGKRVHILLPDI